MSVTGTIPSTIGVGNPIEASGLIPAGTTITGIGSNTITLSNTASGGSATATVFPYGNGNGTTTFNVINMSGRVPVGNGGTGTNASPSYSPGSYSSGEQAHALSSSENGQHNHGVTDPEHEHVTNAAFGVPPTAYQALYSDPEPGSNLLPGGTGITGAGSAPLNVTYNPANVDEAAATGISIQTSGAGSAHNNMQPFSVGLWLVHV